MPILLFFIALVIGAAGPAPTVTAALLAPIVMLLSKELGLNPLLLAVMAGNGGHAGGMSPIAVGGIIATGLTDKLGLADVSMVIWFNNILVHLGLREHDWRDYADLHPDGADSDQGGRSFE